MKRLQHQSPLISILLFLICSSSLWKHVHAQSENAVIRDFIFPLFFNLVSDTLFDLSPFGPADELININVTDPLNVNMAHEKTVGFFDIDFCDNTEVLVTTTISDMEGLSSLQITDTRMTSFQSTGSTFEVSAILDNLELSFEGVVEGFGCDDSISDFYTSTSTIINPTLSFTASTSSTGVLSVTLSTVEVTNVTLSWDSIEIDMTGIDDFGSVESQVQDALAEKLGEASRTSVNDAVIQEAIEAVLPSELGNDFVMILDPLVFAFFPTVVLTFLLFKFIQWVRGLDCGILDWLPDWVPTDWIP